MGELVMIEIDGGYCVKRLNDQYCVDLMKMMSDWRIGTGEPPGYDKRAL
ncbi:hypothetical protein [Nocardia sp. NPDC057030]